MNYSDGAPCRHRGAPSEQVIAHVIRLLSRTLPDDCDYLEKNGLTREEYEQALGVAVEQLRGSMAASNQGRRTFVEGVVELLVRKRSVVRYDLPKYGGDTVYRLWLEDGKQVGVVQKGCPDGKHSSVNWSRPEWADELYLWWVCDSKRYEPGEHVWKGVNRVRGKVSTPGQDQLDGIIFFNQLCGTAERPCPKAIRVEVCGEQYPPPCIYVFPRWRPDKREMNWRGQEERSFPGKLLQAFGVAPTEASNYSGFVGFRVSGGRVSTEVTSRFGTSKSTTARG